MPNLLSSTLLILSSLAIAQSAQADLTSSQLNIAVNGLRSAEGQVCVKLFSGSSGFPNDDNSAVQRQCIAIGESETPMTVTFTDVQPGSYAIAAYHDSNGDEQLNRGAFGMPTEGYAFSNDAVAETGPAAFEDAVFLIAGPNTAIQIEMKYMQ
ncbi:MAG: DUF2141 domain-containing protein [Thainema sp.]